MGDTVVKPTGNVRLEEQGGRFQVKSCDKIEVKGGAVRGVVKEFSAGSRRRLMGKLASLDRDEVMDRNRLLKPIFITLTYGQSWPGPDESKRHLRALVRRIERASDRISGIWRMEFQERGAPHFHLMVFGAVGTGEKRYVFTKEDIKRMWGAVIGEKYWNFALEEPDEPFTRIESITSWRACVSYVSKYISKIDDKWFLPCEEENNLGASDADEVGADASGFINITYRDGIEEFHDGVGRLWGVFRGDLLPFATLKVYELGWKEGAASWLGDLLSIARVAWYKFPKDGYGVTFFCDSPEWWRERMEELAQSKCVRVA